MISFTPEQFQIIAANAIGVLRILALCMSYAAADRGMFLILSTVSMLALALTYAVSGLWLPSLVFVGFAGAQLYNSRERTNTAVNVIIVLLSFAAGILLQGTEDFAEEPFFAFLPIFNAVTSHAAVAFIKSYPLLMAASAFDSVLWLIYNLRFGLVSAMVSNLICIVMPAVKMMLAEFDRHSAEVTVHV